MTVFATLPLHLLVAGGLLASLVLSFLACFLVPGLVHWARLRKLQRAIAKFELRTPPGEFRKLFAVDARLSHLWKEYQDSLHIQREERDGQMVPIAVRSTLPAETFFNSQYVVDARLRTEFFKHLPGIFTGIGIIGTFYGLIEGLRQFQVSDNAATVRASLESLMHSVGQAFLVSASAIAAAMIVTFLEKLLLASLYGRTEDIAHAIDARFDAGAGEDYLSRLVKSSEDSAHQSKSLKDALVAELATVMREQTQLQIQAARADAASLASSLSSAISASIGQSLSAPLQSIAGAVQTSTGEQGTQTAAMLQDVMNRFGDRLNGLLGGQASGINELNQQTGASMQHAVQAIDALVDKLGRAGSESAETMSARLQSTLQAVEQQVGGMLAAMGEHSAGSMDSMSDLLAKAITEMSTASTQMARSVDALTQTTSSALDRMNSGADRLGTASASFATAGDRVGLVMDKAAQVSSQLVDASASIVTSAHEMRGGLDDYRSQREATAQVLAELRGTMESARKEASITADVLSRIQQSSERLGEAQQHADQYLAGVSKVLGDAHQAFAVGVKKTLELANLEFHAKLSTAVGLLSSTVVELEATLGHATAPQRH